MTGRALLLAAALTGVAACDLVCQNGGACGGSSDDPYCDCDTFYSGDVCEDEWDDFDGWQPLWLLQLVVYVFVFGVIGAYSVARLLEQNTTLQAGQSNTLSLNILRCNAIFCLSRAVWQVNQYDYVFDTAYMWELFFQMGYPSLSWAYFCVLAQWIRTHRTASGEARKASAEALEKRRRANKWFHAYLVLVGLGATVCVSVDWHGTAAMRLYYLSFCMTVAWIFYKFRQYGTKIRTALQESSRALGAGAGSGAVEANRAKAQDKIGLFVDRLMLCIAYAVIAAAFWTTLWQLRNDAWAYLIFNVTCRAAEVYMVLLLLSVCKLPKAKSPLWAFVSVKLLGALEAPAAAGRATALVRRGSDYLKQAAAATTKNPIAGSNPGAKSTPSPSEESHLQSELGQA